ncbi:uncharacterized protein LOC143911476 [Arctopsyche grandis]|uniref:uncharacterized protein LOC143911476 n=1 Tax=Arctopsyche grandis TaxID=121162 RepID=UPI00406D666B
MSAAAVVRLPPEVVEVILRYTDGRTLARCKLVCRSWRHIVQRLQKEMDLWKSFCLTEYPDAWGNIYEKGNLSWSDIYVNICLWTKLNSAWVKIELLQRYSSMDKEIITVNISKEGSLNVTLRHSVKLYDIETLTPTEEIFGQYFCYFENKFVRMIHSENHTLFLKPSIANNSGVPRESVAIDNVYLFRVNGDVCYYITLRQELCMYNLRQNNFRKRALLVKWYNSDMIIALDCHKNKIYLLTNSGKILTYECNRLVKIRDVKWPYNSTSIYKKYYLFRGNIFFYCDYSNFHISLANNKEITYTGLFVSCILLHGNILIVGTYFGLISMYLLKSIEDLLILDKISPISSRLLCVDYPISGIDIYEERGCHSVFAWTASSMFMIKYDHLLKNYNEKLLCNSFAVCSLIQCSEPNNYTLNPSSAETI